MHAGSPKYVLWHPLPVSLKLMYDFTSGAKDASLWMYREAFWFPAMTSSFVAGQDKKEVGSFSPAALVTLAFSGSLVPLTMMTKWPSRRCPVDVASLGTLDT